MPDDCAKQKWSAILRVLASDSLQADARRSSGCTYFDTRIKRRRRPDEQRFARPLATCDRLRVLLVTGAPTWDVRYIRRYLKKTPALI